jgi:hypothetical protein
MKRKGVKEALDLLEQDRIVCEQHDKWGGHVWESLEKRGYRINYSFPKGGPLDGYRWTCRHGFML